MNIEALAARHLKTLTVLLVEDDLDAAEEIGIFLGTRVGAVITAPNGEAGLAAFLAQAPQLVVTDIQMPGMDGLAMVEGIRARAPRVPVIVTTAFEKLEYLERSIDLGVDRFVLKPIQAGPLEKALQDCANRLLGEAELRLKEKREADAAQARQDACRSLLLGGLAHDFNNLLQAVLVSVETASMLIPERSGAAGLMKLARQSSGEATLLARRLAMLGGMHDPRTQVGSLEPLIERVAREALAGTDLVWEGCFEGGAAVRHSESFAQVIRSLVDNAREAMPGGGRLRIATAICPEAPEGLPPGKYLRITCQDTGRGIPDEIMPMIFAPYFSTKTRGQARGTGLGLAVAEAIVHAHGGVLTAQSPPEGGARFTLHLPIVEGADRG